MIKVDKNEIILANIIAAILNIETKEKIISKSLVLNDELYADITFMNLFSSNAFISNQERSDLELVQNIKCIYQKYSVLDLTEYEVVQLYLDEFLEKNFENYSAKVIRLDDDSTKDLSVYLLKEEVFDTLTLHQKLLIQCFNPTVI